MDFEISPSCMTVMAPIAVRTALVDAMNATGILQIAPQDRNTVIDALASYTTKVASP